MLIKKPVFKIEEKPFNELQKMAAQFLPKEQVKKFADFPHLIEKELQSEAREPEIRNILKDLFNALHEKNTPKLLKVLQGDKERIFYAFRNQLLTSNTLTSQQAKALLEIYSSRKSLLSISLMK